MSRYIDIDPVLREAYRRMKNQVTVDLLEELPIANVVEVVHGEWIPMGDADKDHNQLFKCSNCGCGDLHAVEVKVPFCWKCGAKMRGGTE